MFVVDTAVKGDTEATSLMAGNKSDEKSTHADDVPTTNNKQYARTKMDEKIVSPHNVFNF